MHIIDVSRELKMLNGHEKTVKQQVINKKSLISNMGDFSYCFLFVRPVGIEPTTLCLKGRCSTS